MNTTDTDQVKNSATEAQSPDGEAPAHPQHNAVITNAGDGPATKPDAQSAFGE